MLPSFKILDFIIYTYPLMMGISWGIGYQIFFKFNSLYQFPIKHFKFYYISTFFVSWIGSKFLFLLTTNLFQNISNVNFWLGGGFVFYGGLIFGLIWSLLFFKYYKISLNYLNLLIPALGFGHAIGRVGCFLAGCCYGSYCELFHNKHPVQLYEAILVLGASYYFYQKLKSQLFNDLWIKYLLTYALIRFFVEFFRGDIIRGVTSIGLSISQIISLAIVLLSILFLYCDRFNQEIKNKYV